ncbi:MAG: enoyl-CoA hydratase/isomerase family protein, partial [Pseudomonadota bacterium]
PHSRQHAQADSNAKAYAIAEKQYHLGALARALVECKSNKGLRGSSLFDPAKYSATATSTSPECGCMLTPPRSGTLAGGTEETMENPLIKTTEENGIATVSFNRPDALNALSSSLLNEFVGVVHALDERQDIDVMVVKGEGRAFSAGVDLKELQGIEFKAGRVGGAFDGPASEAAAAIRNASTPVIASVHGFCFTGALELALHCDAIYTTETTKFGDTHAKWGLRPTWGMSQNLARAVGVRRARELSFTARTFTGSDAVAWGMAIEAAADNDVLDALVAERASAIASGSSGAIAAYKSLYRLHEQYLPLEEALEGEITSDFPDIVDTNERLAAFGSK